MKSLWRFLILVAVATPVSAAVTFQSISRSVSGHGSGFTYLTPSFVNVNVPSVSPSQTSNLGGAFNATTPSTASALVTYSTFNPADPFGPPISASDSVPRPTSSSAAQNSAVSGLGIFVTSMSSQSGTAFPGQSASNYAGASSLGRSLLGVIFTVDEPTLYDLTGTLNRVQNQPGFGPNSSDASSLRLFVVGGQDLYAVSLDSTLTTDTLRTLAGSGLLQPGTTYSLELNVQASASQPSGVASNSANLSLTFSPIPEPTAPSLAVMAALATIMRRNRTSPRR